MWHLQCGINLPMFLKHILPPALGWKVHDTRICKTALVDVICIKNGEFVTSVYFHCDKGHPRTGHESPEGE